MRFTTWLLVLLCLGAVGLLGGLLFSGGERTPKELLESARRRANGADPDFRGALSDLDTALKLALQEKPSAEKKLVADILVTRGTMLRGVNAASQARTDFQAVLDTWRPGDPEVELKLVDLDMRDGALDAALERTVNLLKREPDQIQAWTARGLILSQIVDQRLDKADQTIRSVMAEEEATTAHGQLVHAAGMDLSDPLRLAVIHDLRSHFESTEEEEARAVLRIADDCSRDLADARNSLVQSFRGKPTRDAIDAYLRILDMSGRRTDSVDFGEAAVVHPVANGDREIMLSILKGFMAMGRPEIGCELVDLRFARGVVPDQDFFTIWCEALYRAERWRQLTYIASQMHQYCDSEHKSLAQFYLAVSQARDHQCGQALNSLGRYLQREAAEPFPGALAIARREQAHCAKAQGEVFNEKPALIELLHLDPNGSGDDWLRYAEVLRQTEPESLDKIEDALTNAVRLLPDKRNDLMPMWAEAGETRLKASGIVVELLFDELNSQGQSTPAGPAGPYEIWRLAELHQNHDNIPQATAACHRLLDAFPGFLPAIDMLADIALAQGDQKGAAEMWLEHLKKSGAEPLILRRLAKLPDTVLTNTQWLELVKIDPERTGRLLAARTLRQDDRSLDALTGLYSLDTAPLGDEGRLLIGQLYADLKRWAPALETLIEIKPGSPQFGEALPLALQAAVNLQDGAKLKTLISQVGKEANLDPLGVLVGTDLLISGGYSDEAGELCRGVDSQPANRSGGVMLRLAQLDMLADRHHDAQENLERAEAYEENGSPEIGRLLFALDDRIWSRLPFYVRELTQTHIRPNEVQSTILALFDERVDECERMITQGTHANPDEPYWPLVDAAVELLRGTSASEIRPFGNENAAETIAFLRGDANERDPRQALGIVFASQSRSWMAWAIAQCTKVAPPAPGSMWPAYIAARGELDIGHRDRAEVILHNLVKSFPSFAPGWALLEDTVQKRVGRFDAIELVRLRDERRKALGAKSGEEAEELLVKSWALEAEGKTDEAADKAREALDANPTLLPALTKLADLERARGHWQDAIAADARACEIAPVDSNSEVVSDFVELLNQAALKAPTQVPPSLRAAKLETLSRRFRRDPMIALELAKLDTQLAPTMPAVGVARAYERLQRFRSATQDSSIESLRPGSTRRWKEFYSALDPARAESFVRSEVEKRPGSIEAWLMLGECLADQGKPDEAIELYELVQRMVPDGKTRRAIAWLLSETGRDLDKVKESIAAAMKLEHLNEPDYDLEFTQARALVHAGPSTRDAGIDTLAKLWSDRSRATGRVTVADVGQFYGTALVQRAQYADRQLASEVLTEVIGMVEDPARKNLVRALEHLALQIPGGAAK